MTEQAAAAAPAAKSQTKIDDKEIAVVSFRSHHHAFSPSDPNVTLYEHAAPLTAPRRLLQFVFTWTMVHYFSWIIPMILLLWALNAMGLWYVSAALVAWYLRTYFDGSQFKKGRTWDWVRMHPLWRLTNRYTGVEVVRLAKLDPSKKYMFGLYPHGILILSRTACYGGVWERLFPGIENRVLGASPMFWAPGCRELCLWVGAVNAAKHVAANLYSKYKLNLMVYPGGSDEIFLTDPASRVTTLVVRKGFIKLAVQSGAEIVPGFVFGEKWMYHVKSIPEGIKSFFMRHFKMPLIVFYGRYFSWMPLHDEQRAFLSLVFGRPISVVQQQDPSDEYIDALWAQYEQQVHEIYNTYKARFGYAEDETLVLQQASSSKPKDKADKKKQQQQQQTNSTAPAAADKDKQANSKAE